MSEFVFMCPHCKSDLKVQDESRGQKVTCPVCSTQFTVPLKSNPLPKPPPSEPPPREQTNLKTVTNNKFFDYKEDNFVLDSIELLKKVLLVLFYICCAILTGYAVYSILRGLHLSIKNREIGVFGFGLLNALIAVLLIIPVYIQYWISKLILCWFRGVYRNLLIK